MYEIIAAQSKHTKPSSNSYIWGNGILENI